LNSSIGPDLMRKPLESGEGCVANPGLAPELPGAPSPESASADA